MHMQDIPPTSLDGQSTVEDIQKFLKPKRAVQSIHPLLIQLLRMSSDGL